MRYQLAIGENKYEVDIGPIRDGVALVTVNTTTYKVAIENYGEVMSGGPVLFQPAMPLPPQARRRSRVLRRRPKQPSHRRQQRWKAWASSRLPFRDSSWTSWSRWETGLAPGRSC